jgi:hypothetical protein
LTRSPPKRPATNARTRVIIEYLADSADYNNSVLQALSLSQPDVARQLTTLLQEGLATMANVDDLNAKLNEIAATEGADTTALQGMGTALTTIIAELAALPPAGVLTQEQLDAAVARATDVAHAAADNAATIVAQSAQATAAATPPVTP